MDVLSFFNSILSDFPDQAIAVAAILTLLEVVRKTKNNTAMGLQEEIESASKLLQSKYPSAISVKSGCSLFAIYLGKLAIDHKDFEDYKSAINARAGLFAERSLLSREKICIVAEQFIKNDSVIFTHGFSRVVNSALIHAAKNGKSFRVIICEGKPSNSGYKMAFALRKAKIPFEFVFDCFAAVAMEKADIVLVGAEGVVENGSIVSQVGTYSAAIIAKTLKKPFYVAVESYKFSREPLLMQSDVRQGDFRFTLDELESEEFSKEKGLEDLKFGCCDRESLGADREVVLESDESENYVVLSPRLDYTPEKFVSLFLTDLGVLTTSAVCEELIRLYC